MMSFSGNIHVWLGCTKTWSPGIGMVMHWQPPDVTIFVPARPQMGLVSKNENRVVKEQNSFIIYAYIKISGGL